MDDIDILEHRFRQEAKGREFWEAVVEIRKKAMEFAAQTGSFGTEDDAPITYEEAWLNEQWMDAETRYEQEFIKYLKAKGSADAVQRFFMRFMEHRLYH